MMYEVYHYTDELGGAYESPHLHDTTDDLQDARRQVRKRGGYVRRLSDGATWDAGTERWFGDDGPLPDRGGA
jgi:hypothetical protein